MALAAKTHEWKWLDKFPGWFLAEGLPIILALFFATWWLAHIHTC
jgi:hypothetical protein